MGSFSGAQKLLQLLACHLDKLHDLHKVAGTAVVRDLHGGAQLIRPGHSPPAL